jgi:hypothetical protein
VAVALVAQQLELMLMVPLVAVLVVFYKAW